MIARLSVRILGVVAVACFYMAHGAQAQQQPAAPPQPTPTMVALAAEILELKGGTAAFDPAIDGVIAHHKGLFMQMNPNTGRALDEVERSLRSTIAAKRQELRLEVARGYASQFSEGDLKELVAFYKTPLGKKIIEQEPKGGEAAARRVQGWIDKYAETVASTMRAELKKKGFSEF